MGTKCVWASPKCFWKILIKPGQTGYDVMQQYFCKQALKDPWPKLYIPLTTHLKIYAATILGFFLGGTAVFLYFVILRIGKENPQKLAKLVKFTAGIKIILIFLV
jgi:hypothetical protein